MTNQKPTTEDVWDIMSKDTIACTYCSRQFYGRSELEDHYHLEHKQNEENEE